MNGGNLKPRRRDELSEHEQAFVDSLTELAKPLMLGSAIVFDMPGSGIVASGALVEYAGERWLATASHVAEAAFRDGAATRVCWAPSNTGDDYHDLPLLDLALAWQPSDEGDIAAILLRKHAVLDGARFVPQHQCESETRPRPIEDLVWLVGSPFEQRSEDRHVHDLPLAQSQIVFHTHVRNACALHPDHLDDAKAHPRDPAHDFHLDWSNAKRRGASAYRAMYRAGGMSGGPLWGAGHQEGELWSREKASLLGVAWYENWSTHCIRAVPFGCWFDAANKCLRLVREEIARRAFLRWLGRKREHGHDLCDWFKAEDRLHERLP